MQVPVYTTDRPIDKVRERLDVVREKGNGFMARCPTHDDKKASLSVGVGDDGETVLMHCFANCETDSILEAIGLHSQDLYPPKDKHIPTLQAVPSQPPRVVERYDYIRDGQLIFQVERMNPKGFRQRRPDGKGGWIYNLQGVDRILYQQDDLQNSAGPVYLPEGEKDVNKLRELGLTAITAAGGASAKWLPGYTAALAGLDVVIVPDNDDPGRKRAQEVANHIYGTAASVRIADLSEAWPEMPEHGDVSDWLEIFTKDDFLDFIAEMPEWTPKSTPDDAQTTPPFGPVLINAADLMCKKFAEPRWAVRDVFPEGLNLLVGAPKLGKSWLALNVAISIALGGRAIGKIPVDAGDVLYLALEDTERRLQERIAMTLQGAPPPARLQFATSWPTLADGAAAHLSGWLAAHPDARLVIIDTFQKLRGPLNGNQNLYAADYSAAGELKRVADQYGVAMILVHHTRKATADDPLDMVSGTAGLAGAADSTCVLRRQPGRADAALYVRGRDVPEADHALSFDAVTCAWTLLGEASEYRLSEERREIIDLLRHAPEPLSPKRISEILNKKDGAVRKLLYMMVKAGEVDNLGGAYRLPLSPGNSGNAGNTDSAGNGGAFDTSVTGNTTVTAVTGVTSTQGKVFP